MVRRLASDWLSQYMDMAVVLADWRDNCGLVGVLQYSFYVESSARLVAQHSYSLLFFADRFPFSDVFDSPLFLTTAWGIMGFFFFFLKIGTGPYF